MNEVLTAGVIKKNKSMFWKGGVVIISYYVAIMAVGLIYAGILFIILKINPSVTIFLSAGYRMVNFIFTLAQFIVGLFGLRYGINLVARQTNFIKKDIIKIIILFLLVDFILLAINEFLDVITVKWVPISLITIIIPVINCFAIFFFSRKLAS